MPPVSRDGLVFFPLRADEKQDVAFSLFPQPVESGDAGAREVSEGGFVPEVVVENRSPLSLLIPEGLIILGLNQNRVTNVSMLVAAGPRATPRLRSRKLEDVVSYRETTGRAWSDQGQVWEEVSESLGRLTFQV